MDPLDVHCIKYIWSIGTNGSNLFDPLELTAILGKTTNGPNGQSNGLSTGQSNGFSNVFPIGSSVDVQWMSNGRSIWCPLENPLDNHLLKRPMDTQWTSIGQFSGLSNKLSNGRSMDVQWTFNRISIGRSIWLPLDVHWTSIGCLLDVHRTSIGRRLNIR